LLFATKLPVPKPRSFIILASNSMHVSIYLRRQGARDNWALPAAARALLSAEMASTPVQPKVQTGKQEINCLRERPGLLWLASSNLRPAGAA
jgi:hypothetical protein